ncbi:hypothetical protein ATE47_13000 [Chryseobacterium sp. IHB B 17019]|jgi:hypothetical protein|uniref:hypothetical protein n=1 Tax=Chryseobacterium sp. IHB B 17019 TaxID=1721091 RepID=UPI00071FCCD1|nr:hypothetical protein [Chryseobacterium sp. IHB B 17019]ALR31383.1 hypothetical protein ATE47_13000 [Chryseobacterium sp. IHB B 17019]
MMSIFIMIGAYRYYAGLAERFGKTKWQLGLLAIAIYLGFQMLFLFCYIIYERLTNPEFVSNNNFGSFTFVNFISWLFAIVVVYTFHTYLEKKFTKEQIKKPSLEIEKIGSEEL